MRTSKKRTFKEGDIVESKMGHDTHRMYVVIALDGEFAFVADGEYRAAINPKKKRQKHLRYIGFAEIDSNITDTQLKRIIKQTKQEKQAK